MIFETLQHGILASEGASPPGRQICTQCAKGCERWNKWDATVISLLFKDGLTRHGKEKLIW
jgi:hypothetical protein